jgi:hypothetical protein
MALPTRKAFGLRPQRGSRNDLHPQLDIASLVHMQTNPRTHQPEGPLLITRGGGSRVWDDSGRGDIGG